MLLNCSPRPLFHISQLYRYVRKEKKICVKKNTTTPLFQKAVTVDQAETYLKMCAHLNNTAPGCVRRTRIQLARAE